MSLRGVLHQFVECLHAPGGRRCVVCGAGAASQRILLRLPRLLRAPFSCVTFLRSVLSLELSINIPLCVAFVDYEKAFDSVQTQAILTSLQEQGIEDVYMLYIDILKDIYTDSSVTVQRE